MRRKRFAEVTQIFRDIGIQSLAENTKREYLDKAFQHLEAVSAPDAGKQLIAEMAESLIVREV